MFLLAKLIAKNLYGQVCSSGVKTELDEANFPKELSKAYVYSSRSGFCSFLNGP